MTYPEENERKQPLKHPLNITWQLSAGHFGIYKSYGTSLAI